jgi:hypothetical protein
MFRRSNLKRPGEGRGEPFDLGENQGEFQEKTVARSFGHARIENSLRVREKEVVTRHGYDRLSLHIGLKSPRNALRQWACMRGLVDFE